MSAGNRERRWPVRLGKAGARDFGRDRRWWSWRKADARSDVGDGGNYAAPSTSLASKSLVVGQRKSTAQSGQCGVEIVGPGETAKEELLLRSANARDATEVLVDLDFDLRHAVSDGGVVAVSRGTSHKGAAQVVVPHSGNGGRNAVLLLENTTPWRRCKPLSSEASQSDAGIDSFGGSSWTSGTGNDLMRRAALLEHEYVGEITKKARRNCGKRNKADGDHE